MFGFIVWNLHNDIEKYNNYTNQCVDTTPYHLAEYLLAEAMAENGITKIFCYEENGRFALIPQIVKRINDLPYMSDLREELYDMITPHEYGGIISNSYEQYLKQKLLEYILKYCKEKHIIFEFIRLNPYLKELPDIYQRAGYHVIHSKNQIYVDLKKTEEQIVKEYKSNVRRNIRRSEKEGLMFEIADKNQKNISDFQTMYQKAMKILNAKKFLYFNDKYFQALIGCDCCMLGFVKDSNGKSIAGSVLLVDKDTVYYHLGCFDREYSLKRPMNYLMHSLILWSKHKGYKIYHLGGGGMSLMQFKEGYSNTKINYYIAEKICDKEKYDQTCKKWKSLFPEFKDEKYYPLYRYNE